MSTSTNPYAEAHASPQGEGDARPTALQIVHDEDLVNNLTDKVMLVTGSSSGIGIDTVRALHATGAHVFMQVRDVVKGEAVMKEILASSEGKGKLEILYMELGSFASIRKGVAELLAKTDKLNVLVNNAGIRNPPEGRTEDGFELQFGTNHLSHFLLFQLLLPTLLSSSSPSFNSRVVNVTSGAHRNGPINFSNLDLVGIYTPRLGYAQSKTANILMANQIERLYSAQGLHGLSVSPGVIRSGAQRYDDPVEMERRIPQLKSALKTTAQGAATTVWAAVAKVWEGKGGKYLEDCREGEEFVNPEATDAEAQRNQQILSGGYFPHAFDEESEEKLWEVSCEMVDISAHSMSVQ